MIKALRNVMLAALALMAGSSVRAAEVIDELTNATFGVTSTSYASTSDIHANSAAVYAAQSAGGNNAIQLRSNNNNSGIVTTASGGKLVSFTIEFNANTNAARVVSIYGKNEAYTAPTELYSADTQGTLLGEIAVADDNKTLTVEGDYTYFGLRSKSGALYIDKITVVWEAEGATKTSTTTTIDATGLTNTDLANGTAAGKLVATVAAGETTLTDAAIAWSSSNEAVATIDAEGNVTLVAAGNATLKAEYAGDESHFASSANYDLTVENSAYQPVGQGTLEDPFTASDAIWLANNGEYADEECYIKGIVFRVATTDANITKFGNIDYYISEDGEAKTPSFEVFRGKYFDDEAFTLDNKVLVGDEVVVKGKLAMYNTQAETAQGAVLVKLVRDGQEIKPGDVVNAPTISGETPFQESTTVTITADEGCTIYYTLDGTDPTTESTQYTEAITLTETTTVKAIAAKGETVSEVATATFTKEVVEEGGIVFDFNADYTTLFGIDEVTSSDNVHNFEASTNSATVEGVFVTVSAGAEGATTPNRIWHSDPRLRLYSGYLMFTSQTNKIEKIVLTRTTNKALIANSNTADSGVLTTSDQQNNAEVEWTGQATRVKITIAGNTQFSKAVVYLGDVPTGISDVPATNAGGAAYNLAGQRVAKGYKGLVIVGGKKTMAK